MNKKPEKTTEDTFLKSIEAKVNSLKETYGIVTPVVITDDEGVKVVGYFQKPTYDTIMYCTDQILNKQTSLAAEQAFKDCFIVAESDPRIPSDERANAGLKAAFTMTSLRMVKPYADEYKKK